MSTTVSKAIMWVVWVSTSLLAMLMAHYLTARIPTLNSFSRPVEVFASGMFLFPILVCGLLRFWLSRIRNPWLALLPFFFGVFFAWQAGLFGIFLLPEFCIVFQSLSVALFCAFLPLLVELRSSPPPLPSITT